MKENGSNKNFLIKMNLLDWFLVLLVVIAGLAVYFSFLRPISFSHLIKREGVPHYAEVEILLPEDLSWLKEVLPRGEESKNVYGDLDWKILSFSGEAFGEKTIVKVTAKVSIVEESSGILRYGKYTLVKGSKIFLINDRYLIEGRILNWRLSKEKVQI